MNLRFEVTNKEFVEDCHANKQDWKNVKEYITKSELQQWVTDLRSGLNQWNGGLKRVKDEITSYCCLGVLGEQKQSLVMTISTIYPIARFKGNIATYLFDDSKDYYLPSTLQYEYAVMNDTGKTFSQIADQIEKDFGLT